MPSCFAFARFYNFEKSGTKKTPHFLQDLANAQNGKPCIIAVNKADKAEIKPVFDEKSAASILRNAAKSGC